MAGDFVTKAQQFFHSPVLRPSITRISAERQHRRYCLPIPTRDEPQGAARDERLAQNEVLFRSVNESIEQQALKLGGLEGFEFICECASTSCFQRVTLTLAEYERVRSNGATFFLAPGHEVDEVELVIERHESYWVVRKDGQAAVIAEFADPRDGDPR